MKLTPLTTESIPDYCMRIALIRGTDERRWGTMTPEAMLRHLRRTLEMSLGEVAVEDGSNILTRTRFVQWVSLDLLPLPRGLKAPAVFTPPPHGDVDVERDLLVEWLNRFVERHAKFPEERHPSPLFGPLSLRQWSRFHGKHFEHHLQQFGR